MPERMYKDEPIIHTYTVEARKVEHRRPSSQIKQRRITSRKHPTCIHTPISWRLLYVCINRSLNEYINQYGYIYIYVYVYLYMYIPIHICIYTYTYVHTYKVIHMYVHTLPTCSTWLPGVSAPRCDCASLRRMQACRQQGSGPHRLQPEGSKPRSPKVCNVMAFWLF